MPVGRQVLGRINVVDGVAALGQLPSKGREDLARQKGRRIVRCTVTVCMQIGEAPRSEVREVREVEVGRLAGEPLPRGEPCRVCTNPLTGTCVP
jgi:hypothetical protein